RRGAVFTAKPGTLLVIRPHDQIRIHARYFVERRPGFHHSSELYRATARVATTCRTSFPEIVRSRRLRVQGEKTKTPGSGCLRASSGSSPVPWVIEQRDGRVALLFEDLGQVAEDDLDVLGPQFALFEGVLRLGFAIDVKDDSDVCLRMQGHAGRPGPAIEQSE